MTLEMVISNKQELKEIDFNFEMLKEQLETNLEKYKNIVYNEQSVSVAKNDRAFIRKIGNEFNQKRLEIERALSKPLKTFKSKVDELVNMTNSVVETIDIQIKTFEEAEKEKKRKKVEKIIETYNTINAPFNMIFENSFLLKGSTIAKIEEVVQQKIEKIKDDFEILKLSSNIDNEFVKNKYFENNCALGKTIAEIKEIGKIIDKKEESPTEETNEKKEEFNITIFATKNQFEQVIAFINQKNIKHM